MLHDGLRAVREPDLAAYTSFIATIALGTKNLENELEEFEKLRYLG